VHALPLLLLLLLVPGGEEPRFQGKTAADWARVLEEADKELDARVQALATGGDEALAVLVRMLESDDAVACWSFAPLSATRVEGKEAEGATRLREMMAGAEDAQERALLLERIWDLSGDRGFVEPRLREIVAPEPVDDWPHGSLLAAFEAVRTLAVPRMLEALDDATPLPEQPFGELPLERDILTLRLTGVGEPVVPALLGPLRSARAVSVRWRIPIALGEMKSRPGSAVRALVEALRDGREDLRVRWAAAMSLRRIAREPEIAVPGLVATLDEEDLRLRWYAIDALGALGPAAAAALGRLGELAVHPELGPAARAALDAIR
jgi:HEAT repeat protein